MADGVNPEFLTILQNACSALVMQRQRLTRMIVKNQIALYLLEGIRGINQLRYLILKERVEKCARRLRKYQKIRNQFRNNVNRMRDQINLRGWISDSQEKELKKLPSEINRQNKKYDRLDMAINQSLRAVSAALVIYAAILILAAVLVALVASN